MSVCAVANWALNFVVAVSFLSLTSGIGRALTFWLYAAFAVLALIFFIVRVPETKGRSLEQIERAITAGGESPRRRRGRGTATAA